jgi:hypothetical protein
MLLQIQAAQGDLPPINQRTTLASLLLAAKKANETPLQPLPNIQASDEAAKPAPDSSEPTRNPVVARCIAAYNIALAAAQENKKDAWTSRREAKLAYREALPILIGRKNIRDFIACVGFAMLAEIIGESEGSRFLQAARVASQVQETRSHHSRQKSAEKAPQSAPNPGKSAPLSPENQP